MASPSAFRAQYLAAKRENERRSKPKAKPKARKAPEPGLKDYATSGLSALYAAANPQQTAFAIGKDLVEAAPGIASDVVDYFGSNSPMDVVSDIGSGLRRAGSYMFDNPVSTAADFTPIVGDVKGFGEDIQRAAELRAAGNPLAARNIERLALPLAVASLLPGVGEARGAERLALRTAGEAALEGAERAAKPKSRVKYQPVEPHPNPHPELADVQFPEGSGRGGSFAVANQVPIVGRRPFIAQSKKGYSGLAASTPTNQVTATTRPFVQMAPRQFVTPEELAKDFNSIVPLIGDKLRGGTEVLDVMGRPQEGAVRTFAGPDFPRQQIGFGGREVWGSGPSVISAIENMAREGQDIYGGRVAGVYTAMGPEAADQSTAMIDLIGKQIAAGNADPDTLAVFDDLVRTTSRKDDEAVPDFIGFGVHPLRAIEQLNDIGRTTMGQRRTVTQLMHGAPWMEAGLPDIGANRAAITTPELLYAPEGTSGHMIAALEPGKGALDPASVSMQHPNYSHKLGGTYLGGFEVGVPRELVWPKLYSHPAMQQYEPFRQLSYLFGRAPKAIRADFGHSPQIQPLDQEWVDNLSAYIDAVKKYGVEPYAEGGFAVRREPKMFAVRR